MLGFKYNGIHCKEFDVVWKTQSRPILPTQKIVTENMSEADGELDFSLFNGDGRMHYENRIISGEISITKAVNLPDLHLKLAKIANWLSCGYASLIFDDMPTTVWTAKVESVDQIAYQLSRIGKTTVHFTCEPFSQFLYDTENEIILNSDVVLDSDFPLECDYDFAITQDTSIMVQNLGDWYTPPIIKVIGNFDYIEIKKNDSQKIRYYGGASGNTITFDFEKNQVEKDGIIDNMNSLGNYWEFSPGENQLEILIGGEAHEAEVHFQMKYYFKYAAVR